MCTYIRRVAKQRLHTYMHAYTHVYIHQESRKAASHEKLKKKNNQGDELTVRVYICIYIHTCTHTYIRTCGMYVYIHVHMHACMHTSIELMAGHL
jgi:hypothetical protein